MYYELYMDQFFLENLCFDFLLLLLTGLAGKLPVRWGRLAVSSGVGSLGACLFVMIPLKSQVLLLLGQVGLSLLMVKWSFAIPGVRRKGLAKSLGLYYLMTFLLGGTLLTLDSRLTLPVIVLGILGAMAVLGMVQLQEKWKCKTQNIYEVTLVWNGMQKELLGLRDTGNLLRDPYFGKPVTVVEYSAVKELFNQKTKVLWIPYHTVDQAKGWMPGIQLDYFLLHRDGEQKRVEHPIVAVSKEKLSGQGKYQLILPSTLTDD